MRRTALESVTPGSGGTRSAPPSTARQRSASPACTSAAARTSAARRTSPGCWPSSTASSGSATGASSTPWTRPAAWARPARPATCSSTAPWAATPRACRAYADADSSGHSYLDAEQVARTCWPAPGRACRPASTRSATPRCRPSSTDRPRLRRRSARDALRAARHRVEHVEMVSADQIATLAAFGVVGERAAGVRRPLGRRAGDVRQAPRPGARARHEPVRGDGGRRRRPGPRLGQPGHAARPLGNGARRGAPPDTGQRVCRPGRRSPRTPGAAGWRPARTRRGSWSPARRPASPCGRSRELVGTRTGPDLAGPDPAGLTASPCYAPCQGRSSPGRAGCRRRTPR